MRNFLILIFLFVTTVTQAQNQEWTIDANAIDPNNYYGVTVANGMVGLVSSPEPMKVKDVVLNGVFDYYQRGRVSTNSLIRGKVCPDPRHPSESQRVKSRARSTSPPASGTTRRESRR